MKKKIITSIRQLKQPAIDTGKFNHCHPIPWLKPGAIDAILPSTPSRGGYHAASQSQLPLALARGMNILCICILILLTGCDGEAPLPDTQTAPATITARMESTVDGTTRATGDIKTAFAPGDAITLSWYNGTLPKTANLTLGTDGTTWNDADTGQPATININLTGNTTVTATHGTEDDDVLKDLFDGDGDEFLSRYADVLDATADFDGTGITHNATTGEYTVNLVFRHRRANIVVVDKTGIYTDIPLYINDAGGNPRMLDGARPALAPAGATLIAVHFINPDSDYLETFAPPIPLEGGKEYTITLEAAPDGGTQLTVTDNITSWGTPGGPGGDAYTHIIATVADLVALRNYVNDDATTNDQRRAIRAIQIADIDLDGIDWEVPIGKSADHPFRGLYNGNGHTISNLTITGAPGQLYTGLFGILNGAGLANIHLRDVDITNKRTGTGYAGAQAGYTDGASSIALCSSTGCITATGTSARTGGLVGETNSTHITRSRSACTVTGTYDIGGLGGYVGSSSAIVACMAAGDVTGNGNSTTGIVRTGGLVGCNDHSTIAHCYSTGTVASTGTGNVYTGGFVGYTNATIKYCYTRGDNFAGNNGGTVAHCWPYAGNTATSPGATLRTPGSEPIAIPGIRTWTGSKFEPVTFDAAVWSAHDYPVINYNAYNINP